MTALIAPVLLVVLAGSGNGNPRASTDSSPDVNLPDKQWLSCGRDSQCKATALSCHGWIAVNAAHEADVQRWYSRENADFLSVVECSGPKLPKPTAVCRRKTCELH